MLVGRPWMPRAAPLGADERDRWGLSPWHVGEVDAGDPGERGPESPGGCVALRAPRRGRRRGEGRRRRIDEGIAEAEAALDVLLAVGEVLLGTVRQRESLGARADLCRAVIPLQRCGHGVLSGLKARGTRRRPALRSAFSRHHGAEKTPAGDPGHSTHHVVQVERPVLQRLVHGLHRLDGHLEQMVAMAAEPAEPANVLRRTQRRRPHAIRRQLVAPPTITASRCRAARDMRDVTSLDQGDRTPAGLEHVQEREPGHPGGCHGDCGATTGRSPVRQTRHVTGNGAQCLDRLGIASGGDTDPMLCSPHLDAGGMRRKEGQVVGSGRVLLAFCGQRVLQSGEERGEQGKTGILPSKDTMGEGARQGSDPVAS
jgi:hypothetical protein